VRKIICGKDGGELIRLKLEADSKGDYHSFHKLVFRDVTDSAIRADILQHIDTHAKVFLNFDFVFFCSGAIFSTFVFFVVVDRFVRLPARPS
jgi:hypothetical protein